MIDIHNNIHAVTSQTVLYELMKYLRIIMMKKKIDELDIPTVREMIEILDDAGAEIYSKA